MIHRAQGVAADAHGEQTSRVVEEEVVVGAVDKKTVPTAVEPVMNGIGTGNTKRKAEAIA